MFNVYPANSQPRQEQTHFFTRNINSYHHDCPFCKQQFYFNQSKFSQNAASLSKSGFHQGPPIMTNTNICDNPTCVVCGKGGPRVIDAEEVYEYQRNLPNPCAICGDNSFVHGIAPFNTLTLRSSQFLRSAPSYMSRSMGPVPQQQAPVYMQKNSDYGMMSANSRSTIIQPSIGERISIRTSRDEYRDVILIYFSFRVVFYSIFF